MGSWGNNVFENDDALDLVGELITNPDLVQKQFFKDIKMLLKEIDKLV